MLREEDLGDVGGAEAERRDAPRDEDGDHRARAERRDEAVGEVAPVAARERSLALQETAPGCRTRRRDRDDERRGVDRVGDRRAGGCAEDRADHPARGSRRSGGARSPSGGAPRPRGSGHRRRPPAGRSRSRGRRRTRARRRRPRSARTAVPRRRRRGSRLRAIISVRRGSRSSSGPKNSPIDDGREELDDEHRADPKAGVRRVLRPLLDVERQRDGSHERADARAERGEEEIAERRQPERLELRRKLLTDGSKRLTALRRDLRDA